MGGGEADGTYLEKERLHYAIPIKWSLNYLSIDSIGL